MVHPRGSLISGPERARVDVTHHGRPCGIVGIGGSVGSGGVFVASGVGGAESDGTGAIVGEVVCVGAAVGAGAVGAADGVAVRAAVALGDVAAGPGNVCGGIDPGIEGEAVEGKGDALGVDWPPASRIRLNPARASAIASDGPSSTYRVKEARPAWPKARPPGFPSRPPIRLVGTSYPAAIVDKWRPRCNESEAGFGCASEVDLLPRLSRSSHTFGRKGHKLLGRGVLAGSGPSTPC